MKIVTRLLELRARAPRRTRDFDQVSREWTARDWADLPVQHPRQS